MATLAGRLWKRFGGRRALAGTVLLVAVIAVGDWALRRARAGWSASTPGAAWIWAEPQGEPYSASAFFAVRDFEVAEVPEQALLHAQADEEVLLLLNGQSVGSRRYRSGGPLTVWDVSALLRPGANRLVAELRSGRGVGGFLLTLEGLSESPIVSGAEWRIVRSYEDALLSPGEPLASGGPPRVWAAAPTGRWGAPSPGVERPLMTAVLSDPGGAPAIRVRLLDSSEWRPLGQVDGDSAAIGDRVIFDWGREVVGYLNVTFEETAGAKALLWAGLEPTGSAGPVSTYLLKPNGRRSWTDSEPTRFRYLIVHSTRPITGARVFELDERARDLVPDVTPALGVFGLQPALSTPSVENEIRRDLEGVTGVADG